MRVHYRNKQMRVTGWNYVTFEFDLLSQRWVLPGGEQMQRRAAAQLWKCKSGYQPEMNARQSM